NRKISAEVSDEEFARRREAMEAKGKGAWKPVQPRQRHVSAALKAYAAMTTSAARGAVRDVSQLE
ncbi:MAG: dihydroxy-acid dehydratase, partial [Gammaproteobacteria bacterium]